MSVLAVAAVIAWCSLLVCRLLVIYFLYGLFARERLRCVCTLLGLRFCTQIDARCCCLFIFALVCARSPRHYTGFGSDRSVINFSRTTRDRALAHYYPPTELSWQGCTHGARPRGCSRTGVGPRGAVSPLPTLPGMPPLSRPRAAATTPTAAAGAALGSGAARTLRHARLHHPKTWRALAVPWSGWALSFPAPDAGVSSAPYASRFFIV